ncbi:GNAT family N-acetyltransferase [Geodermatophilus sp. CPCC 206100]|uniref:GNAT family N-acetyltransferase n=1 Tax=Geodermatophilus sp. CPCC 206100 TaxID=3020054 RepID=UPI003B00E900
MTAEDGEPLLGGGLLYGDPRFADLNGVPAAARWRYEHRRAGRLVGVLTGVVTDGVLVSGASAPFGGPDLVRDDPPVEDVLGLVSGALAALRADGVRELQLRARPPVYSAAEPLLEFAYLHGGLAVTACDLNQHVDLSALPPGTDPTTLFRDRKRRYVRTARRRRHELVEVTGGEDLTVLHGILAANRAAHGRPPPLPRDYLERARAAFPGRIRLQLLRLDGEPAAAAVVYRVLDDVDQVVHWADADRGRDHSPMDLLAALVLADAARRGARLVDLGPSRNADGTLNAGLADFKRAVGARPSARKVFGARLD